MRMIFMFFLILIIYNQCAYCQKNSIKGFIFPPFVLDNKYFFGTLSLGYERTMKRQSRTMGLTLNILAIYLFEDGYALGSILFDYRKKNENENHKLLKDTYGGIYSIVSTINAVVNDGCKTSDIDGKTYSGIHIGLGLSGGKIFYLNKKKKLFIDLGAGSALTYFTYTFFRRGPECRYVNKKHDIKWLPRVILLLGYKF